MNWHASAEITAPRAERSATIARYAGRVLGILCLVVPGAMVAQSDPRAAQPERPTVSAHAGTVARGYAEVELGFQRDTPERGSSVSSIGGAFKIGTGERTQLAISAGVFDSEGGSDGIGDIGVALKWRLADGRAFLGDFAIVPRITLPTGDEMKGTGTGEMGWSLRAISSRDLANRFHLDVNARAARPGGDAPTQWLWSAALSQSVSSRFGWAAEVSGVAGSSAGDPTAALLFGPTFTVKPALVIDVGGIVKVAGPQPRGVYVGVTHNTGRIFGAR